MNYSTNNRFQGVFDFFKTNEKAVFFGILLLALLLRLYKLHAPLADWHSFRQADTASVTREYVKNGIDLLHPRYHDLSNIQAGTRVGGADNVEGWRMVEFPFVNAFIAVILRTFPALPLVQTSRIVSIIASLGTIVALYYLVKNVWNTSIAQLTVFTFAVLPYSIFYSRVILPEPFVLFFSSVSLLTFYYWLQTTHWKWLLSSSVCLSLALLLKPFTLFLAPVYAVLYLSNLITVYKNTKHFSMSQVWKVVIIQIVQLAIFLTIAFFPLYLWRTWIQQFPSGIPVSDWLFNSNGIRFRPAWFRWLGYERLTKMFLGYFGIIFLPFAFLPIKNAKQKNNVLQQLLKSFQNLFQTATDKQYVTMYNTQLVLLAWWFGIFCYFAVIATGNVQHDYYQNLMLPILCLTIAVGMSNLYYFIRLLLNSFKTRVTQQNNVLAVSVVGTLFTLMILLSWQQISGFYNINHWEYIEAGAVADQLLPQDAKVIAPAMGDTVFLFQTNRTGWPIGFDIYTKIKNGAEYYISTSYDDEARELESKYATVKKNNQFIILNLTKPITPADQS